MKRTNFLRIAVALLLIGGLASIWGAEGFAQEADPKDDEGQGSRTSQVDLFGGSAYTGGYLKYSYQVSREGVEGYSVTTTEILGFRVPTTSGGTVDLSPLTAIENEVLEPNHEYVLPDGGFLVAGDSGNIAGLEVVYATYTHADFTNVRVNLALPTDLAIRNLLPLFPFLQLEYQSDELPEEGADGDYQMMRSFSKTELIEFVYEPQ